MGFEAIRAAKYELFEYIDNAFGAMAQDSELDDIFKLCARHFENPKVKESYTAGFEGEAILVQADRLPGKS